MMTKTADKLKHKHEDLSLDPPHPHTNLVGQHACIIPVPGGDGDKQITTAQQPASLPETVRDRDPKLR